MLELISVAFALSLLGLLQVVVPARRRTSRGFTSGKTVALDDVTLRSERLKLVGRPDRIVRDGAYLIPEEWKSAKKVSHGHRLQVIAYCLLIEEHYGKRPPYGVVVNDGSRVVVENTEAFRSEVLAIAERIRERRRVLGRGIEVRQPLAKCRACGHRGNCGQASRYWQGEASLKFGRLFRQRSPAGGGSLPFPESPHFQDIKFIKIAKRHIPFGKMIV